MTKKQVVILGAGYAGLLTTVRFAGQVNTDEVEITLVNASDTFAERVRMHQIAGNQKVRQHGIEDVLRNKEVTFVQGWVTAIDTELRYVNVKTNEGENLLTYDNLVYALGSYSDRSQVAGAKEYAYSLDMDSIAELHTILPRVVAKNGRFVVVGSGLTGIEAATEFAEQYPQLQVSLVTRGELGDDLSAKGQAHLRKRFAELKIEVLEHTSIDSISEKALLTAHDQLISFDICLWSAGFGVPQLAKQADIAVNDKGQVWVDEMLRSISHPEIFAIGDSATLLPSARMSLRMGCVTAMPMGGHTAENLLALYNEDTLKPFAFGYMVRCMSLGRRDALVQMVTADDTPKEQIITGRLGVMIKELIVKSTIWGLYSPSLVAWRRSKKAQSSDTIHQNDGEKVTSWNSLNNTAQ